MPILPASVIALASWIGCRSENPSSPKAKVQKPAQTPIAPDSGPKLPSLQDSYYYCDPAVGMGGLTKVICFYPAPTATMPR